MYTYVVENKSFKLKSLTHYVQLNVKVNSLIRFF